MGEMVKAIWNNSAAWFSVAGASAVGFAASVWELIPDAIKNLFN